MIKKHKIQERKVQEPDDAERSNKYILSMNKICKVYGDKKNQQSVLKDISLNVKYGELVAIIGPSGSGKSTLLQIAGLLDTANSGNIFLNDIDCTKFNDKKNTLLRRKFIGFIYQFHNLMPEFTVLENLLIPQLIYGTVKKQAEYKVMEFLDKVGMRHKVNHFVTELSGGEQQRIAVIRGMINDSKLILADEPTGNLDSANTDVVMNIFMENVKKTNTSVIIVTHNNNLAKKCNRIINLNDGSISV